MAISVRHQEKRADCGGHRPPAIHRPSVRVCLQYIAPFRARRDDRGALLCCSAGRQDRASMIHTPLPASSAAAERLSTRRRHRLPRDGTAAGDMERDARRDEADQQSLIHRRRCVRNEMLRGGGDVGVWYLHDQEEAKTTNVVTSPRVNPADGRWFLHIDGGLQAGKGASRTLDRFAVSADICSPFFADERRTPEACQH